MQHFSQNGYYLYAPVHSQFHNHFGNCVKKRTFVSLLHIFSFMAGSVILTEQNIIPLSVLL